MWISKITIDSLLEKSVFPSGGWCSCTVMVFLCAVPFFLAKMKTFIPRHQERILFTTEDVHATQPCCDPQGGGDIPMGSYKNPWVHPFEARLGRDGDFVWVCLCVRAKKKNMVWFFGGAWKTSSHLYNNLWQKEKMCCSQVSLHWDHVVSACKSYSQGLSNWMIFWGVDHWWLATC